MKLLALSLLLVAVSGCTPKLNRAETVAACKECTDAGFDAVIQMNGMTLDVRGVRCGTKLNEVPSVRMDTFPPQ